ncbi:MAG TPA: glutathione ABC transporter substrate-binding protein [Trueperaceae bacterium]|nr:glutathione ABC transporter substrate-binding protein [Trueperaceae bacterium]
MRHTIRLALASLLLLAGTALGQQTVRIAQSLSHNTLNPAATTGLADASVERVIFEGLVGLDKDLKIVPELATSWTISPDATVFTFELRQGVTFQDGTAFNADAVKAYFDWATDKNNKTSARAQSLYANVKSIDVLGPYEVRFTLTAPDATFLSNIALYNGRILSPASIQKYGADVGRHPVGTGPFKFVSWQEGQKITVEANDSYWGPKPKVQRIEFIEVPNAATRVAMLQSGEADFIESLPAQLVASVNQSPNLEAVISKSTYARIFPLNTHFKPFTDVRVRQALNYAVDKEQLVKVAVQGYGTVMDSPVPQTVRGYAAQTPYQYDPEKAKQLLAEAGYPNGFSFTVLTFNSTEFKTAGQVIQTMLAKVGVKVELNPTERGALVSQIFKPLSETQLEGSLVGASTPNGDADRTLTQSFATSSFPPAFNNWSFYSNPEVDKLIQEGRSTGDQAKRDQIYAQAQSIIWKDAPWIFLYSPDNIAGQSKKLTGVYYMPGQTIDARGAAFSN